MMAAAMMISVITAKRYDYERAVAHGCGRARTYDVTHLVGAQLYAVVSVGPVSVLVVFHISSRVRVGF